MKLTIEIELDNAAFEEEGPDEVSRILANLAERLPCPLRDTDGCMSLHDLNGNWVGKARIE